MSRIRVLIVDDSALMRQVLSHVLGQDSEIEVVGTAGDPYQAWDKIQQTAPQVVTLDVEMPRMDGLTFLEKLMLARPTPVVMISSLTESGCQTTFRALELGAVDFVTKPKLDVRTGTLDLAQEIVAKVKGAARAKPRRTPAARAGRVPTRPTSGGLIQSTHCVVAIGASTGGTEALYELLRELPPDFPGVAIVQHMPSGYTKSFAERLDKACRIRVHEARDGMRILPGMAVLAPGDFHLEVQRSGAAYLAKVTRAPPVNRFRPSVDVLFTSCARNLGRHTVGVILTGMGRDGAAGMRAMFDAGAHTIAQDEASCVVFGMPKEAIAAGGVRDVLPLERIGDRLQQLPQISSPAPKRELGSTQGVSIVPPVHPSQV
ncbi:MAG: chemotaxis response regulator protein-glutamate methylesterase [Pirellulaceae bacterium]